jgi:two-component system, OmpR family, sensor histidine kinase CpxA
MRARVPLYAKILGWFFLNLVLLVAVFVLLFNAQFSLNLDWLFAAGARDRFEAVRGLIVGELNTTTPDEWHQVLSRYNEAYHVRFALLDDSGHPLVGEVDELPEEVRGRIRWWTDFGRFRRPPGERFTSEEEATPRPERIPESRRRGWRPPLRGLVRTSSPTRYWLLTSTRIDNPHAGDPMRVILLVESESLSSGGLILDLKPWLAVGLGAVVFSLLFWLPLVRGITRSIRQLTLATRQIANGQLARNGFSVTLPMSFAHHSPNSRWRSESSSNALPVGMINTSALRRKRLS